MTKKRIVSGMRPTGRLHLGNLFGALANWKNLQDDYDCFFFVADWHALTSDYADTKDLRAYVKEMLIDWLSVGLSRDKATMFIQSHVKEHAELFVLLSTISPLPWLERNPTYKEQKAQIANRDLSTYGFLGYPVLQAADIIIYKADRVPVGIDQLPHVELTREIARRFNHFYGSLFPIPDPILTNIPKLLGIDGRKMSKSYNNALYLSDKPADIASKVSQMVTDPQRARRKDPGDPNVCNVFAFHKLFSKAETIQRVDAECRAAEIGCVECKKIMAERLAAFLAPIREKREYYENHQEEVADILREGTEKARAVARETMEEVRSAMKI
ncbi:MAG: tryptophan--tRNA ligase [Desulfobacterales bacterium C00003106]|jgi:tryptophanyl-tRNA synthetase|nr:MAG: tryptophan--tRNA ligase [Desulfobacterales bacterium C00003106]